MNNKITFQELVEAVADQSGRSKQFTHDFIKDFALLIKDGLEKNGSVNVAGLGTFKLKKMDEREGYNPQTEEKITIPAHNKIDFSPYKEVSELVNAPYAHMEAEILEEEVQSSSSSEETEKESTEEISENQSEADNAEKETGTEKKKAPWEEDMESEIEVDEDDPFGLNAKHKMGPTLSRGEAETSNQDQEEPPQEDAVASGEDISAEPENEQNVDPKETEGQQEPPQEEEATATGFVSKKATAKPQFRDRTPRRRGSGGSFWVLAAAFIILLLAIGAWYLLGTQQQNTPQTTTSETSQVLDESETQAQESPEADGVEEQRQDTEAAQQQAADETESQQAGNSANQADGPGQQTASQNNQDADTNTTAPVETVTVTEGQTLWGLADNAYQNPYLWPWIYDTNQPEIEDPDLIYAGQLLDIPQRRGQNNQLSNSDSLQVALGYVETYLWYKENNLDNARFYLYAAKKYHSKVFEYTDATFDEDDLRFANRAQ